MITRSVGLATALLAIVVSACGGGPENPPADNPEAVATRETVKEIKSGRRYVVGRTKLAGALVGVVRMSQPFEGMDGPNEIVARANVGEDGGFKVELAEIEYNSVYAVARFRDVDGDGKVDEGEEREWARAKAQGTDLRGIFIFTAGGTFVDDRICDLSEAEFYFE